MDGESLAYGFAEARDTAYKGEVKPVEGTILTVIRGVADATEAALQSTSDAITILEVLASVRPGMVFYLPNNPFVTMSKKRVFKRGCITGQRWAKALDVEEYDRQYAEAVHYIRVDVLHISLMEAERRSGLSHQFWSKVEKGESHPCSHNEVRIANALRVRPHVIHRLTERWARLGRRLEMLLLFLLPYLEPAEVLVMGA